VLRNNYLTGAEMVEVMDVLFGMGADPHEEMDVSISVTTYYIIYIYTFLLLDVQWKRNALHYYFGLSLSNRSIADGGISTVVNYFLDLGLKLDTPDEVCHNFRTFSTKIGLLKFYSTIWFV